MNDEYEMIEAMEAEMIQETYRDLQSVRLSLVGWGIEETDVRLQYMDGAYALHTGEACYDTDHRGYWGCGSVSADDDDVSLMETARDLVSQMIDHAASVLS